MASFHHPIHVKHLQIVYFLFKIKLKTFFLYDINDAYQCCIVAQTRQ